MRYVIVFFNEHLLSQDDDDGGIGSGGATIVLAIQPFLPKDIVGIEETTLAALQVLKSHQLRH